MVFNRERSMSELEEEGERVDSEITLLRKRLILKELKDRAGAGFWRRFSSDGTQRGVNFRSVIEWLKTH